MDKKVISIDIVTDIISASYTGGQYKGREVFATLKEKIIGLEPGALFLIDFQKANPLDYVFCRYAFGPIIELIHQNTKPTIFKMQQLHKGCFYGGILKHITGTRPKNKSPEEMEIIFNEAGFHTMIATDGNSNINFIGNIDSTDSSILNFINESHCVSSREIIDAKKEIKAEIIVESLKSLNKKGFIMNSQNGSDKYLSVYEFLKSI